MNWSTMDLARVAEVQDQKDKAKLYEQALDHLFNTPSLADSKIFIEHLANSNIPLVVSRPILSRLAAGLDRFPEDIQYDVATFALATLITREVSFDDQVTTVREFLAGKLQQREEWGEAAKMLSAMDVERAGRDLDDTKKLEHYINVTMLFLEDEDSVSAERFLVKARNLIGEASDDKLNLRYKACYARICDSKRKFLEAATHYYDLSTYSTIQTEDSIAQLLQAAVTCAILHPASLHRSRMLAMLYKDERVADTAVVPQFPFLEKMLMERIITTDDVQAFDSLLKDHQRALLPDGFSVLESAVIQHNIRSVAGMYDNITLDQLAALLGLSVSRVETLTCDMISEGRLKGHVDQVDNVVYFEGERGHLAQWDEQITGVCNTVNTIVDKIVELQSKA